MTKFSELLAEYFGVEASASPNTDAEWVQRLRETAKHLRENAISLRKHDFMADEARARELAALYIGEIAELFECKGALGVPGMSNDQGKKK